jgi:hypothetical protein
LPWLTTNADALGFETPRTAQISDLSQEFGAVLAPVDLQLEVWAALAVMSIDGVADGLAQGGLGGLRTFRISAQLVLALARQGADGELPVVLIG